MNIGVFRQTNTGTFVLGLVLIATALVVVGYGQDRSGEEACISNLKQYALGVLMYVQDYDERYPPMKMPAQVQNRINPYIKNRGVFSCPVTKTDYLPNPALNYVP